MKIKNVGETVVMMGSTSPAPRLELIDDDGTPHTQADEVTLEIFTETPFTLTGVKDNPNFYDFAWGPEDTAVAGTWTSVVRITEDGVVTSLFGPSYLIYDPYQMWANPGDVLALAGTEFSEAQAIRAINYAQFIVGAWVSVPVQSPVPIPIRQATTLLAAHALTTPPGSSVGGEGQVVSESIADYTVRYASPSGDYSALASLLPPGVASILAPYHGSVHDVRVAPVNAYSPLPVTLQTLDWVWWGDAVIYDEEIEEMLL